MVDVTDRIAPQVKKKKKPLQFMVDDELFNEFSKLAADKFGHRKGAKTQYFEYLMEAVPLPKKADSFVAGSVPKAEK